MHQTTSVTGPRSRRQNLAPKWALCAFRPQGHGDPGFERPGRAHVTSPQVRGFLPYATRAAHGRNPAATGRACACCRRDSRAGFRPLARTAALAARPGPSAYPAWAREPGSPVPHRWVLFNLVLSNAGAESGKTNYRVTIQPPVGRASQIRGPWREQPWPRGSRSDGSGRPPRTHAAGRTWGEPTHHEGDEKLIVSPVPVRGTTLPPSPSCRDVPDDEQPSFQ